VIDVNLLVWASGVLVGLIGLVSLAHLLWVARHWPRSRGRVVDNVARFARGKTSASNLRRAVYFPLIEFDVHGQVHHAKGAMARRAPWKMGETVELYYKPSNPRHVLGFDLAQRAVVAGALLALGAALITAS